MNDDQKPSWDEQRALWRDGKPHTIGPLALKYSGLGEFGPEGVCAVETESDAFPLQWMDAEAIAFCIYPTADLWLAYESDREVQPHSGEFRGWLRLKLTSDAGRLGAVPGWTGKQFPVARLILDCTTGQIAKRKGERTTDYRRNAFLKQGGPATDPTRTTFIHASTALAQHLNPRLPAGWGNEAKARWWAADQAYQAVKALSAAEVP